MMSGGGAGTGGATSLRARIFQALPVLTRFVRRRMGPDLAARESASDIVQSTCRELLRSALNFGDRGEARVSAVGGKSVVAWDVSKL